VSVVFNGPPVERGRWPNLSFLFCLVLEDMVAIEWRLMGVVSEVNGGSGWMVDTDRPSIVVFSCRRMENQSALFVSSSVYRIVSRGRANPVLISKLSDEMLRVASVGIMTSGVDCPRVPHHELREEAEACTRLPSGSTLSTPSDNYLGRRAIDRRR
jgi:hypothetical protein